mgnify:CR=1 FL=1
MGVDVSVSQIMDQLQNWLIIFRSPVAVIVAVVGIGIIISIFTGGAD